MLLAPKEVFEWVREGKKTIDVRKGKPIGKNIAVFECGPRFLRLEIVKKEVGKLSEIVRPDNYLSIIPSAKSLDEALVYFRELYGTDDALFTAYYLAQPKNKQGSTKCPKKDIM